MMDLKSMFKDYTHNIAIIYAHLDGQYPYNIIQEENYVMLLTPFDYHYVAGNVPIESSLFRQHIISYIKNNNKKEFVLFAPTKAWEDFLGQIIKSLHGVIDYRYQYTLDTASYINHIHPDESCDIDDITSELSDAVLQRVSLKNDDTVLSYATALMTGNNHVEIDVFTDELYLKKGLAYRVSKTLVHNLITQGFVPEWNCWQIKTPSQKLAEKLGFTLKNIIPAFVWVDTFKTFD